MTTTATKEYTERQEQVIADFEEKLLSGRHFSLCAASERSRFGYEPPLNARRYQETVEAITKLLKWGGYEHTMMASDLLSGIRHFAGPTESQFMASLFDTAAKAVEKGYTDIALKASPEPGRPSDWEKKYKKATIIHTAILLGQIERPGSVGWCLAAIAERSGLGHLLPRKGDK